MSALESMLNVYPKIVESKVQDTALKMLLYSEPYSHHGRSYYNWVALKSKYTDQERDWAFTREAFIVPTLFWLILLSTNEQITKGVKVVTSPH